MNARQKAKKYKKMMERYKDKANAWDAYTRYSKNFYGMFLHTRRYGTIETLKVVKWWNDRVPEEEEEFFKKEMAMELADCLLRKGYIDFKLDNEYNEYNGCRKMTATLKVTQGGYDDIY